MSLWGTIINAIAIIAGGLLGSLIPTISAGIRRTVMQGLGLAIVILGISMALQSDNLLITIGSLVLGGVVGELIKIEKCMQMAGDRLEKFVNKRITKGNTGKIAEGFITSTLVYCVGAMAILGAIDSGLRNNHDILYTKSMLDGISAIIFASTLGIGVIFSSIPVFLYQGAIALSASLIFHFVTTTELNVIIAEVTAVGGVLIVGIGLSLLEIKKINIANLLPSLLFAAVFAMIIL